MGRPKARDYFPHVPARGHKVGDVIVGLPAKRRSKYGAKRTTVAGHSFASKAEAARYAELALLQKAGKIGYLELQPRFDLAVNGIKLGHYTADFRYSERAWDGNCGFKKTSVVEDVKGYDTRDGKLRRRLAEALHGIRVTIITRSRK